jgi:hypothetical protein
MFKSLMAILLVLSIPAFGQNPLDNLGLTSGTPAAAAYSLRKLSTAYTGSAIRVRRSSDNAEADIGFATAAQTRTNLATIPINIDGGSTAPGVTMTVTGTGTEFGQPYVEVRWQGTATIDFFLQWTHSPYGNFNSAVHAPIVPGLNYTVSFGYRLVAGTAPGGTWVRRGLIWDANGSHPGTGHPSEATPSPSSILQRHAVIFTAPAGSSYAQPNLYVLVTSGQVVDFTMRFYAANVEQAIGNARPLLQRNVTETVAAIGELDAEALLSFVGTGNGFVTTWYDQSGNGRNAAQTTATLQPRIVSNGALITENGRPYIDFTGNKGLVISNYNALLAFTAAVLKSDTSVFSGFHTIFDGTDFGVNERDGGIVESNQTYFHDNVYPTAVWKNGTALANPFNLAPITTPFQLSIQNTGGLVSIGNIGNYDNGSLGGAAKQSETIVFSSVPSTTNRQTLERNQGQFYGITII